MLGKRFYSTPFSVKANLDLVKSRAISIASMSQAQLTTFISQTNKLSDPDKIDLLNQMTNKMEKIKTNEKYVKAGIIIGSLVTCLAFETGIPLMAGSFIFLFRSFDHQEQMQKHMTVQDNLVLDLNSHH